MQNLWVARINYERHEFTDIMVSCFNSVVYVYWCVAFFVSKFEVPRNVDRVHFNVLKTNKIYLIDSCSYFH